MPEQDQPIAERYRLIGEEWADADAAYYMLDTSRTAVLAQIVAQSKEASFQRAESNARASAEYREHIQKTTDAKRKANLLRVRMEYLKMRFALWNSSDANQRAERKMVRQAT
jgi:hypothetical protein